MERTTVEDKDRGVVLEVLIEGAGPDVVLVPSAMRGAEDFAVLQAALTVAGYRTLAVNPRGAGRSTGELDNLTLRDVADDLAFVISERCEGRAHLVGHALGNILVRATASCRPEVAATVTVMPCGGHDLGTHPVAPEVIAAVGRCHDQTLPESDRLAALEVAFFAPGNDASVWLNGWWPGAGGVAAALGRSDPEEWWRAGTVPMLIIQPLDDAMAAPEVGRQAAAALGRRATYREIPHCGHAILPEQPDAIAHHLIEFLRLHAPS
jgi:pimeloyl-ACP methyl ester carboxylesterase